MNKCNIVIACKNSFYLLNSVRLRTFSSLTLTFQAKACKLQMPSPKSSLSNNSYPSMKQDGAGFVTRHSENFPFPKGGTDKRLKRSKLASCTQPVIATSVISYKFI